jgi:hypothetical protein
MTVGAPLTSGPEAEDGGGNSASLWPSSSAIFASSERSVLSSSGLRSAGSQSVGSPSSTGCGISGVGSPRAPAFRLTRLGFLLMCEA